MPRENVAASIVMGPQARAVPLYSSSVGQKLLVGLTGLFLCSFLVVHLTGNFLLFRNDGGRSFDTYSDFMSTNAGIRAMEIGLALGFLIHIILAVKTWVINRMSRSQRYAVNRASATSKLESRITFITGSAIFIFLVIHIRSFVIPARFAGAVKPSMYELVREAFRAPLYDFCYLIALALLAYHLKHGFQAAMQTFGLRPGREKCIDYLGIVFWLLIPLGFASMPVYFYWLHMKGGY